MKRTKAQETVLRSLINGATLKSHRSIDGTKVYKLHPLDGPEEFVSRTTVDALREKGLIHSNQKFPAATYLLTQKGEEVALTLEDPSNLPLSARNF